MVQPECSGNMDLWIYRNTQALPRAVLSSKDMFPLSVCKGWQHTGSSESPLVFFQIQSRSMWISGNKTKCCRWLSFRRLRLQWICALCIAIPSFLLRNKCSSQNLSSCFVFCFILVRLVFCLFLLFVRKINIIPFNLCKGR